MTRHIPHQGVDFANLDQKSNSLYGEKLYVEHGISFEGEAATGYQILQKRPDHYTYYTTPKRHRDLLLLLYL